MKSFILHATCYLLFIFSLQGAPVPLNPDVEKPPYPDPAKDPACSSFGLKTLLEQGSLEEFYKKAALLLKENGRIQEKKIRQFQHELWIFYYIAAVPLYHMDESLEKPIPWREDKILDYRVKTIAAQYMASQDINKTATDLSLPQDKIAALYALYVANILHSIRESCHPDLKDRQKRWQQEQEEKNRQLYRKQKIDFDQANLRALLIHNKVSTQDLRNNEAGIRKEALESTLLDLLVEYFPGNAAKVRKYIKLAGYSDKEIPGLIDRAIGRDSKTEFLYKGAGRKKGTRP